MYEASGTLIFCRWLSCALAKGRLVGLASIQLVSIKELYYDARPTKSQQFTNIFKKFGVSVLIFIKSPPNIKFHENPLCGSRARTYIRADGHDEVQTQFSQLGERTQ